METRVTSAAKEVLIGFDRPTVLMAVGQVVAGADILDVNVGVIGVNEDK